MILRALLAILPAAILALPAHAGIRLITTVAGNGSTGTNDTRGDGGAATSANLSNPTSVVLDAAGNLYISDTGASRIRKVDPAGVISTIAGSSPGYGGDNGPASAALLNSPAGLALDAAGNLYVADSLNHRIRKIDTLGNITTVAGRGTPPGSIAEVGDNGPATSAALNQPYSVHVDAAGNLYIADLGNHRVRKVSGGTITTFAGTGIPGFNSDGIPASFAHLLIPTWVSTDGFGNAYIADSGNNAIRKVDAAGMISTFSSGQVTGVAASGGFLHSTVGHSISRVPLGTGLGRLLAGTGAQGFAGDNGNATGALVAFPAGLTVTPNGDVLFADSVNNRIRKVFVAPSVATDMNGDGRSDLLWRNAATGQVYSIRMNGLAVASDSQIWWQTDLAWKIVANADFNGDGVEDLLWRNTQTGQLYEMAFNANGTVKPLTLSGGVPTGSGTVSAPDNSLLSKIMTADLNGDGFADLVWWSPGGRVDFQLLDNLTVTKQGFLWQESDTNWRIIGSGDFNGNGRTQLLWRHSTNGKLFMMSVNVSSVPSATGAVFYQEPNLAWKNVGIGDFDDDGKSDILWRNDSTGQVYMMLMNGMSIAGGGFVWTEPNLNWKIVSVADYNGDGKSDILWRNDATGQVYMMLMNGMSVTSAGLVWTEPNTAWRILGPTEYAQ